MRNKFGKISTNKSNSAKIKALDQEVSVMLQQAWTFHAAGQLAQAQPIYEDILRKIPTQLDALHLLGALSAQSRQWQTALDLFNQALRLDQGNAQIFNNCGTVLQELGRFEEALNSYDKAIAVNAEYADAYKNRGVVLRELQQFDASLQSFDKAILCKKYYADAYYSRGNLLQELRQFEAALNSFDSVLSIKPDHAQAYNNRGLVLEELKQPAEALKSFEQALAINSNFFEAHYNRGNVLREFKQFSEVLQSYANAIALKEDSAEVHWNKSLILLLTGDFQTGWREYEWRWRDEKNAIFKNKREFSKPLWLGAESLVNKSILLHSEQGFGDTIQFCRYARMVADLGATVILEVPPTLVNLITDLAGVAQLIAKGSATPHFDFHCPLMSLPLAFNTTEAMIPYGKEYLKPRLDKVEYWRSHIGDDGFKIGICWQGSTGKVDAGRSFPVNLLENISGIEGVRLISLQKNAGVEQLDNLPEGMKIETLPADFDSGADAFLDSAAVLSCMDLVITSDTALTHLAGALDVRTWLALKEVPDWRWMLDRADSPWYPKHRLFRQTSKDDWSGVFAEMAAALKALISGTTD